MAPFLYFAYQNETVYTSVPTLEHISALKVAINLWNQNEVRALLNILRLSKIGESDQHPKNTLEDIKIVVQRYARSFSHNIPAKLVNKVLPFVSPIGQEIYHWKAYHEIRFEESQDKDILLPDELCWTIHGTIDRKRTAQALVRDPNICIMLRFKFACAYCLESDVKALWDRLPNPCKLYLAIKTRVTITEYLQSNQSRDLSIWKLLLGLWCFATSTQTDFGDILGFLTIDQSQRRVIEIQLLLYHAYTGCSQDVLEYLISKVSPGAKQEFIDEYATSLTIYSPLRSTSNIHPRVYFFLLSQLNEEQQRSIFGSELFEDVVEACMKWPCQDQFPEVLRHLQYFMPSYGYLHILDVLYINISEQSYDYPMSYNYYQHIFEDALELCPEDDESVFTTVVTSCTGDCLLERLVDSKDKNNIMLIWNRATAAQREDIVCFLEEHITYEHCQDMHPFLMGLIHSVRKKKRL